MALHCHTEILNYDNKLTDQPPQSNNIIATNLTGK